MRKRKTEKGGKRRKEGEREEKIYKEKLLEENKTVDKSLKQSDYPNFLSRSPQTSSLFSCIWIRGMSL